MSLKISVLAAFFAMIGACGSYAESPAGSAGTVATGDGMGELAVVEEDEAAVRRRMPQATPAQITANQQSTAATPASSNTDPRALPLIKRSDITYLGAFRLTQADVGTSTFRWGGSGLSAYHDGVRTTLFMMGNGQRDGHVAQVEVPATVVNSSNWIDLPEGRVLQPFADINDGKLSTAGDSYNGMPIFGMLVYNNRLISAVAQAYGSSQVASHGASTLNLASANDFSGFFPFTSSTIAPPRALGGHMITIPNEWQSAFGGPALTGNCCLSIIGATSAGPAATVFDPDDVGRTPQIPGKTVLFYPLNRALCGPEGCEATQNDLFNNSTRIRGMAFPAGSRTVMFVGGHGIGPYCYGTIEECNVTNEEQYRGPRAAPYRYQIWAYDAIDLLAVKNGNKQTYEPRPYAVWTLPELPGNASQLTGVAFDHVTRRLFVTTAYGDNPRVDVYQVAAATH